MFALILTLHIIICLILIFIVLLQSGRGAELGAAFGGMGQADSIRAPETFISKLTAWMAGVFMITSILLALYSSVDDGDSVVDKIPEPAPAEAPAENTSDDGQ